MATQCPCPSYITRTLISLSSLKHVYTRHSEKSRHLHIITDSKHTGYLAFTRLDCNVLPHIILPHIVLPHVNLPHIILPHIILSHIVLPHIVLSHVNLPHSVLPHIILPHIGLPDRCHIYVTHPSGTSPHTRCASTPRNTTWFSAYRRIVSPMPIGSRRLYTTVTQCQSGQCSVDHRPETTTHTPEKVQSLSAQYILYKDTCIDTGSYQHYQRWVAAPTSRIVHHKNHLIASKLLFAASTDPKQF